MVFTIGHGRSTKRRRNGGRRPNVSLGNNQADSDRENVPDPIEIQIQIPDNFTNSTQEESKVCEDESRVEMIEKETAADDVFYMLLRSTDIADLLTSNLCSKEYVSYGISTMINEFAVMIGEKFS